MQPFALPSPIDTLLAGATWWILNTHLVSNLLTLQQVLAAGDAGLRTYICSVFKLLQALGNAQLLRNVGLRNSISSVPSCSRH